MDRVLDRVWTTETFLDWEDRQEGRFEFDGRDVSAIRWKYRASADCRKSLDGAARFA